MQERSARYEAHATPLLKNSVCPELCSIQPILVRRFGIEAKYWLKVDGELLNAMPPPIFGYRKLIAEGLFHVQYHAIELSLKPASEISRIGEILHMTDSVVRRELMALGYSETGLDHVHFNIELTAEEAKVILGHMSNFVSVKIFLPATASFQKIEDLSKRAAIAMGDKKYSPDGIIIRRGENICYHTWFKNITAEGLKCFYTSVDLFLKSLNTVSRFRPTT
jgi:hypothetical protein